MQCQLICWLSNYSPDDVIYQHKVPRGLQVIGIDSVRPLQSYSLTTPPAMEKQVLQEIHYEELGSRPKGTQAENKRRPSRSWGVLLIALLAGGWFFWPHCRHAHASSIEDRVYKILTHTPLIGEFSLDWGIHAS